MLSPEQVGQLERAGISGSLLHVIIDIHERIDALKDKNDCKASGHNKETVSESLSVIRDRNPDAYRHLVALIKNIRSSIAVNNH